MIWPLVGALVLNIMTEWVRGMAEVDNNSDDLLALLTAVDDVEGKKMNRFGDFARKATADPSLASAAFLTITQPGKQIEHLIINFHHVLTRETGDNTLQIVLARMEQDVPAAWRCHMPNDVLLPANLLKDDAQRTLFAEAARTRKTQIIPDIESHLMKSRRGQSKYVPIGNTDRDRGSIICKPLESPQLGRVLYVLSVKSDHPESISKKFERKHALTFKCLCTRLLLEAHLEVIRACAGGSNED